MEQFLKSVEENSGGKPTYFVTGAWGCGAFGNNPTRVFKKYKILMDTLHNDSGNITVIFAVPGKSPYQDTNLKVAQQILSK